MPLLLWWWPVFSAGASPVVETSHGRLSGQLYANARYRGEIHVIAGGTALLQIAAGES